MGTRSLTIVRNGSKENSPRIITMYKQMDGYPEGYGKDLAKFLSQFTIVNGISLDEKRKIANGMGCLAAQLVAHFKDGPGSFYLEPGSDTDELGSYGEEYIYDIYGDEDNLTLDCFDVYSKKVIFSGNPKQFNTFLKTRNKK